MPYKSVTKQREAEARYRSRNKLESHLIRRLRKRGRGARISIGEVRELIIAEPNCAYCGSPALHIEHCTPLSKGGTGDIGNLVMACDSCNLKKGSKTVLEFLGLWPKKESR